MPDPINQLLSGNPQSDAMQLAEEAYDPDEHLTDDELRERREEATDLKREEEEYYKVLSEDAIAEAKRKEQERQEAMEQGEEYYEKWVSSQK